MRMEYQQLIKIRWYMRMDYQRLIKRRHYRKMDYQRPSKQDCTWEWITNGQSNTILQENELPTAIQNTLVQDN